MSLSFVRTNSGNLTVYNEGEALTFEASHPKMNEAKEALKNQDWATLKKLSEPAKAVCDYLNKSQDTQDEVRNRVELKDGVVFYNGEVMHDNLTNRIVELQQEGLPFEPMLKFLENLMENPSMTAREELWDFASHKNLPITEDGCLLAYKRVCDDWKDFHSGLVDWSVGKIVEMPRSQVADRREVACHKGLHVGSMEYVSTFNSGGHIIVVKVNPRDVVSVPLDCSCQKMRCCRAEVVSEYTGLLTKPLYDSMGNDKTWDSWDNYLYNDNDDYNDKDPLCPECGDYTDCEGDICEACQCKEDEEDKGW